ncbi:MAG: hypothetical protein Q7T55_15935, partial [Solirubrobacteraceae bacterium]|nr:hypothetical protein [Solirubrobacteraceae bacterium]
MWIDSARAWGVAAVVAALLASSALPASAAALTASAAALPAPAAVVRDDYPTWDQVNAAKANAQSKAAEVQNIQNLLAADQDRAAQLANEAFQRGQEYLTATYDQQAASSYADTLTAQAAEATGRADAANAQVGKLVAQLYRAGGDSTINLILDQNDSESLLYRLGTMSKLTEQTSGIRDQALAAQNTADALTRQAEVAKAERDRLAQAASEALAAAEDAQSAAEAELAATQSRSDQLVAQLASLNDTTAEVERQYQAGAAYRAQQAAAAAAAAAAA